MVLGFELMVELQQLAYEDYRHWQDKFIARRMGWSTKAGWVSLIMAMRIL
jgi:hypothetical protein